MATLTYIILGAGAAAAAFHLQGGGKVKKMVPWRKGKKKMIKKYVDGRVKVTKEVPLYTTKSRSRKLEVVALTKPHHYAALEEFGRRRTKRNADFNLYDTYLYTGTVGEYKKNSKASVLYKSGMSCIAANCPENERCYLVLCDNEPIYVFRIRNKNWESDDKVDTFYVDYRQQIYKHCQNKWVPDPLNPQNLVYKQVCENVIPDVTKKCHLRNSSLGRSLTEIIIETIMKHADPHKDLIIYNYSINHAFHMGMGMRRGTDGFYEEEQKQRHLMTRGRTTPYTGKRYKPRKDIFKPVVTDWYPTRISWKKPERAADAKEWSEFQAHRKRLKLGLSKNSLVYYFPKSQVRTYAFAKTLKMGDGGLNLQDWDTSGIRINKQIKIESSPPPAPDEKIENEVLRKIVFNLKRVMDLYALSHDYNRDDMHGREAILRKYLSDAIITTKHMTAFGSIYGVYPLHKISLQAHQVRKIKETLPSDQVNYIEFEHDSDSDTFSIHMKNDTPYYSLENIDGFTRFMINDIFTRKQLRVLLGYVITIVMSDSDVLELIEDGIIKPIPIPVSIGVNK